MVRILFLFEKLGFMNLIIIIANKTVIILFLIENSRCFIANVHSFFLYVAVPFIFD